MCLDVCRSFQTDSHPLEFLVGRKGSSRDTFNQVLLQTTVERERGTETGIKIEKWRRYLNFLITEKIIYVNIKRNIKL